VFLFGNQKGAGTTKISITKDKRKIRIATRTKISISKNHINGGGYEDGRILVTPQGFMHGKDDTEEKRSIEDYKKEYGEYIGKQLGVNVADIENIQVVTEESDL
jgi:hypothetical protein